MTQLPSPDRDSSDDSALTDNESHTRTLTDLFDELDRASFRRALAVRDASGEPREPTDAAVE